VKKMKLRNPGSPPLVLAMAAYGAPEEAAPESCVSISMRTRWDVLPPCCARSPHDGRADGDLSRVTRRRKGLARFFRVRPEMTPDKWQSTMPCT